MELSYSLHMRGASGGVVMDIKNKDGPESDPSPLVDKVTLWKSLQGSVPGGDEVDALEAKDERLGLS